MLSSPPPVWLSICLCSPVRSILRRLSQQQWTEKRKSTNQARPFVPCTSCRAQANLWDRTVSLFALKIVFCRHLSSHRCQRYHRTPEDHPAVRSPLFVASKQIHNQCFVVLHHHDGQSQLIFHTTIMLFLASCMSPIASHACPVHRAKNLN